MNLSKIKKSIFLRDAFSLSGGAAVAQIIAVLSLPILTRIYSPDDFGVLSLYIASVSFLSVFASLKLEQAIMLPELDRDAAGILVVLLVNSLVFTLIVFVVVWLLGDELLEWTGSQKLQSCLYLFPLSIFLMGICQGLRFWHMRQRHFRLVSQGLVGAVLINCMVSIFIGTLGKSLILSVDGLVIGYFTQGMINTLILLKGLCSISQCFKHMSINHILHSALAHKKLISTLLLSQGIALFASRLPVIVISSLYGNTVLGFYSMAERIVSAPALVISNALGDIFRQRAAVAWRDKGRFDDILWKTVTITGITGIPIYCVAILIAPMAFMYIFGDEWREAGEYASILLIGGMFSYIITPIDKGSIIVGAYRYIFTWNFMRLFNKLTIVIIVYLVEWEVKVFLIALVSSRILLYIVDLWYELKMAKGEYRA